MKSLVWIGIMVVNKGFLDHGPNPFLINLLKKNFYRKTLSRWWAVNKPCLCNAFLPLWVLCVRLKWNGSHSISLPYFPSAQANHFINVIISLYCSLFGYICSCLLQWLLVQLFFCIRKKKGEKMDWNIRNRDFILFSTLGIKL